MQIKMLYLLTNHLVQYVLLYKNLYGHKHTNTSKLKSEINVSLSAQMLYVVHFECKELCLFQTMPFESVLFCLFLTKNVFLPAELVCFTIFYKLSIYQLWCMEIPEIKNQTSPYTYTAPESMPRSKSLCYGYISRFINLTSIHTEALALICIALPPLDWLIGLIAWMCWGAGITGEVINDCVCVMCNNLYCI